MFNNYTEQLDTIKSWGHRVYSQHGEDGITQEIFSRIGVTNQKFLDIGIGTGQESNTPMLAINHNWTGLCVEKSLDYYEKTVKFFRNKLGRKSGNVVVMHENVTAENVNRLVGIVLSGDIDFFSIDIDSNEYWIWRALKVVRPRIVLMEYNSSLGKCPVTVPYRSDFNYMDYPEPRFYYGASLAALNLLAHDKDYILAGVERTGVNAYFIDRDTAKGHFLDVPADVAFSPNSARGGHGDWETQLQKIKDMHLTLEHVPT